MLAPQRSHAGAEETRSRILNATREIFERNGTRGTTTREVADRAGVNEATLFRHFGSKAALLVAMRYEFCNPAGFREMIASMSGADMEGELKELARRGVAQMRGQRQLMCIALAEDAVEGLDDPDSPEWRGPSEILDLLTRYLGDRVAEGRLAGEPGALARALMGMLFQLVIGRKIWQGFHGSEEIDDATVEFLVDVFLNGVRR